MGGNAGGKHVVVEETVGGRLRRVKPSRGLSRGAQRKCEQQREAVLKLPVFEKCLGWKFLERMAVGEGRVAGSRGPCWVFSCLSPTLLLQVEFPSVSTVVGQTLATRWCISGFVSLEYPMKTRIRLPGCLECEGGKHCGRDPKIAGGSLLGECECGKVDARGNAPQWGSWQCLHPSI